MTWQWEGSKSWAAAEEEKVLYTLGGPDRLLPALVALQARYGNELHSVAVSPEEMDSLCMSWLKHRGIIKEDYDTVCRTLDEDSESRAFWSETDGWYGYEKRHRRWTEEELAGFNDKAVTVEYKQVVRYTTDWQDT